MYARAMAVPLAFMTFASPPDWDQVRRLGGPAASERVMLDVVRPHRALREVPLRCELFSHEPVENDRSAARNLFVSASLKREQRSAELSVLLRSVRPFGRDSDDRAGRQQVRSGGRTGSKQSNRLNRPVATRAVPHNDHVAIQVVVALRPRFREPARGTDNSSRATIGITEGRAVDARHNESERRQRCEEGYLS